jgi:hypothetical protein
MCPPIWAPNAPISPLAIRILSNEVGKLSRVEEACAGKGWTITLGTQGIVDVVTEVVVVSVPVVVVSVEVVVEVVVVVVSRLVVVVRLVVVTVVVDSVVELEEQPATNRDSNMNKKHKWVNLTIALNYTTKC